MQGPGGIQNMQSNIRGPRPPQNPNQMGQMNQMNPMNQTRMPMQQRGPMSQQQQQQQNPQQRKLRYFLALFDYDPLTMSPNPDSCEEELPFREGDTIKVKFIQIIFYLKFNKIFGDCFRYTVIKILMDSTGEN